MTTWQMPEGLPLWLATPVDAKIVLAQPLCATAVFAANILKDIRENVRNLTGGRLHHYERLLAKATQTAFEDLQKQAQAAGFAGVTNISISHPRVSEGAVEVLICGNGFFWAETQE
jgi:uncharacterized protein YbjQ (UPF0145 family)